MTGLESGFGGTGTWVLLLLLVRKTMGFKEIVET